MVFTNKLQFAEVNYVYNKIRLLYILEMSKIVLAEKNCPDIKNEDPKKKSKLEEGKAIGCLASGYFGDYIDVTILTEEGYLDLAEIKRE